MVDLRKALAGIRAPGRGIMTRLFEVPLIAELEAMLVNPRTSWTKEFEDKASSTSLALFGVTPADTQPADPHPDDFAKSSSRFSSFIHDDGAEAYDRALVAWHAYMGRIAEYEKAVRRSGLANYWRGRGFDVCAPSGGEPLACMQFLHRALYAAVTNLLPGARLTLDGSGGRAAQSVDEWEAALLAEAKRFRPSR